MRERNQEELVDNFFKSFIIGIFALLLLLLLIGINTTVNTMSLEWCRILLLMTLYKLKMKTSHYLVLTCIIAVFSACKGQNKETEPMEQTHLFTNELIHETSPYLLQHAHNP
jgi:hypothetical protein